LPSAAAVDEVEAEAQEVERGAGLDGGGCGSAAQRRADSAKARVEGVVGSRAVSRRKEARPSTTGLGAGEDLGTARGRRLEDGGEAVAGVEASRRPSGAGGETGDLELAAALLRSRRGLEAGADEALDSRGLAPMASRTARSSAADLV
jgi:hypothetical protein